MEVSVFMNLKADRPCYVRILEASRSLDLDFNFLLRVFRLLYGNESVVVFKVID